jgi:hypothetical protein
LARAFESNATADRPELFSNSSAADSKAGITLNFKSMLCLEAMNQNYPSDNLKKKHAYLSETWVIISAAFSPAALAISAG